MPTLNSAKLRTLTEPGFYNDGGGLYLRVQGAGKRAWVFRFKLHGRAHRMGLGPLADVSLAEARDLAGEARKAVREGKNPIMARREHKAELRAAATLHTFKQIAEAYIAAHAAGWRNAKHGDQWRNTLETYAYPILGGMPVTEIATGAVMRVLQPIWAEKTETASRLRGRIESVLDFASARGWRTGENPARWRGHLDNLLPARAKVQKVDHHAALPWREIGAFMATLAKQPGTAALALRFGILTASRTGEVIGARWGEIDLTHKVWIIPAERMKANREHRVPLSSGALAVLTEAAALQSDRGADAFVFPGGKPGKGLSNMALLALLKRMERTDLTAHGFRSTFRDWCGESTNHPREVAEAALAHSLKDKAEAAYARGDLLAKRARLMEDWSGFCARPMAMGEAIPIRKPAGG